MPRGQVVVDTVTLLFTDIEGNTRLWEAHPDSMREALARHDALVGQAIEDANGWVFKTVGDAFHAAFTDPGDALKAVVNAQLALAREPWPEETPIKVRMALHTGSVESRDDDYFGPAVKPIRLDTGRSPTRGLAVSTLPACSDATRPRVASEQAVVRKPPFGLARKPVGAPLVGELLERLGRRIPNFRMVGMPQWACCMSTYKSALRPNGRRALESLELL